MKILLAIDGSTASQEAVKAIVNRPWPAGAEVKVISVVELHLAPPPGSMLVPDSHYLKLLTAYQRAASEAVKRAEESILASNTKRKHPIRVETQVIIGYAKEAILDEAKNWNVDLIVLYARHTKIWNGR